MRRMSIGSSKRASAAAEAAPPSGPLKEVLLRSKNASGAPPPPGIGPGFMRRSCTFVTEGSWRKSSFGMGGGQKETKDKVNLALQVRLKATQLGGSSTAAPAENSYEDEDEDYLCDLRGDSNRPGKMSRFVGNLKSWSSSEDVRQSVVGAFTRTVHNIKQTPVTKKVKKVLSRTNSSQAESTPPDNNILRTRREKPKTNSKIVSASKSADNKGSKQPPTKSSKAYVAKTTQKNPPEPRKVPSKIAPPKKKATRNSGDQRWLKHLQDAQTAYDVRGGRRSQPPQQIPDPEDSAASSDQLRD